MMSVVVDHSTPEPAVTADDAIRPRIATTPRRYFGSWAALKVSSSANPTPDRPA